MRATVSPAENQWKYHSPMSGSMPRDLASKLQGVLLQDEPVESTGLAQCVNIAERLGRGAGEGRLVLTSRRLFHWLERDDSVWLSLDRSAVVQSDVSRMGWPGGRQLELRL